MAVTLSLFVFFAVVTFAVVMFFTRPSATARVVERRLAGVRMAGNPSCPVVETGPRNSSSRPS